MHKDQIDEMLDKLIQANERFANALDTITKSNLYQLEDTLTKVISKLNDNTGQTIETSKLRKAGEVRNVVLIRQAVKSSNIPVVIVKEFTRIHIYPYSTIKKVWHDKPIDKVIITFLDGTEANFTGVESLEY